MPSRSTASPAVPPADTSAERLQDAVANLSQNVRVLTDIVDQIREDLNWLTRNGVPHQPLHVLVHSIPVGLATKPDSVQLSVFAPPNPDPTVALTDDQQRSSVIDQLSVPLGELAQEQLNALLGIMDHAHREILTAIRSPSTASCKPKSKERGGQRQRSKPKSAPASAAEPPPPAGQLF